MGTRMHRALGYGLLDLDCRGPADKDLHDARIDAGRLRQLFDDDNLTVGGYCDFLRQKLARDGDPDFFRAFNLETYAAHAPDESLSGCIIFDPERCAREVLLIVPPGMPEWQRSDDPLDYYGAISEAEENDLLCRQMLAAGCTAEQVAVVRRHSRTTRVQPLAEGIYPFDQVTDRRDGRALNRVAVRRIQRAVGDGSVEQADKIARGLGFADYGEYSRHAGFWPPVDVCDFCEYAGIFTDPEIAASLRPMMLRWWG